MVLLCVQLLKWLHHTDWLSHCSMNGHWLVVHIILKTYSRDLQRELCCMFIRLPCMYVINEEEMCLLVYHCWNCCVKPFIVIVRCFYPSFLCTLCGMASMKQSWPDAFHFRNASQHFLSPCGCMLIQFSNHAQRFVQLWFDAFSKNPEGEVWILLCLKSQVRHLQHW